MTEPKRFLHECRRVLRPRGRLVLSTPNDDTSRIHMHSIGMHNEFHIYNLNHRQLQRALEPYFASVVIFGQRRKGSRAYQWLRAADVFNLRLRLLGNRRREQLQHALGVPVGVEARRESWIFSRPRLRQANNFVAVCSGLK